MVTVKVKDGTPEGLEPLCASCRSARVVKGFSASQVEYFCGNSYPERRVPFLVAECTAYDDTRLVSRCDMERIAWILVTRSAGRPIGFVSADQFRQMQEDEEILPVACSEPKMK